MVALMWVADVLYSTQPQIQAILRLQALVKLARSLSPWPVYILTSGTGWIRWQFLTNAF